MIDPQIPLMVRPVQIDLGEAMRQGAAMKQMRRQDEADQQQDTFDQVMSASLNPDGSFNRETLQKGLAQKGLGQHWFKVEQSLNGADTARLKLQEAKFAEATARQDYTGSVFSSLETVNDDPDTAKTAIIASVGQGFMERSQGNQIVAEIEQAVATGGIEAGRAIVTRYRQMMVQQSEKQRTLQRQEASIRQSDKQAFVWRYAASVGKRPEELTDEDMAKAGETYARFSSGGGAGGATKAWIAADAPAIAKGIVEGKVSPDTSVLGRNSEFQAALTREMLKYPGFSQAKAQTDWKITQKFYTSVNSTQQVRLKQAITTAYHSLDIIDAYANAWDAGQWQDLNKARAVLAERGGIGGTIRAKLPRKDPVTKQITMVEKDWTAAEIATGLNMEIADVTSEMANVYMGGNSPTDHSMALAAKNLNADWRKETLLEGTALGRVNLTLRENAITNSKPTGTSANNPYYIKQDDGVGEVAVPSDTLPTTPPAAGKTRVTNEKGTLYWDVDDAVVKAGLQPGLKVWKGTEKSSSSAATGALAPVPAGHTRMWASNGEVGFVPTAGVEAAKTQGFALAPPGAPATAAAPAGPTGLPADPSQPGIPGPIPAGLQPLQAPARFTPPAGAPPAAAQNVTATPAARPKDAADVREMVRQLLLNATDKNGQRKPIPATEANIDAFLAVEANRKALGLK